MHDFFLQIFVLFSLHTSICVLMRFQLYDLYTSFNHPGVNHANGCPAEESACSSISGRKCGDFGVCQMVTLGQSEVECVCKPGYRPSRPGSSKCDTGLHTVNTLHLDVYSIKCF